jgi:hypothetical protein
MNEHSRGIGATAQEREKDKKLHKNHYAQGDPVYEFLQSYSLFPHAGCTCATD